MGKAPRLARRRARRLVAVASCPLAVKLATYSHHMRYLLETLAFGTCVMQSAKITRETDQPQSVGSLLLAAAPWLIAAAVAMLALA